LELLNKKKLLRISFLLIGSLLLISFFILPHIAINRARFIGATFTFFIISWGLYYSKEYLSVRFGFLSDRLSLSRLFFESKAGLILILFIVLIVCWSGLDIFMNPYLYDYNHGNGAYCSQVMHNLCVGLGPENTVKYNEVLFYKSNPYFYASAFSAVPHILPLLLLTPIYCLYPHPPMHVFSVVILVMTLGSWGTYLAVRALDASKTMALAAAVGYCVLPWVELPIFMHGHFDAIAFAIYPLLFASLFSRRWIIFHLFVFLLAIINIPYTYSVMALGVIVAIFFKAPRHGLLAIAIGISVMLWDRAIIQESLCGIWDVAKQPAGTLFQIIKDLDAFSFVKGILFHGVYLFLLLMTVSFLPLFGIKKGDKWNWPIIGILLFALVGAFMGLFRSYDIASHRNANMVVPVYLSAFMVITGVNRNTMDDPKEGEALKNNMMLIFFLIFTGIASTTLWFSHHYPWAGLTGKGILSISYIKSKTVNKSYEHILSKLNEYVPETASVAYRIDAGIQAYITNRQKAWYIGLHPEGVEYYFIQTKEIIQIDKNLPPWKEYLAKVENDRNNRLLYKDEGLVIYKNTNPQRIPRLESVLGWDVLLRALLPGRCNSK